MSTEKETFHPLAMEEKSYTLIFCRRETPSGFNEILLGMKKRGFGTGKWNGFGGKIESGESAEEGAIRELEEESSLVVSGENMLRRGYLVFNMQESQKIMKVHVYETWKWSGNEAESDEMRPQWWRENSIPFELTWLDDKYWMPLLLESKTFVGRQVTHMQITQAMRSSNIYLYALEHVSPFHNSFCSLLIRFDYSDDETITDYTLTEQ